MVELNGDIVQAIVNAIMVSAPKEAHELTNRHCMEIIKQFDKQLIKEHDEKNKKTEKKV